MQNLTPEHLRCAGQGGLCPAVYDITPPHLRCAIGTCPGVFETVATPTQLLIIGKKPGAELMSEIEGKVGPDEHAIVIGAEYFTGLVQTLSQPGQAPSGHPNVAFAEPDAGTFRQPQGHELEWARSEAVRLGLIGENSPNAAAAIRARGQLEEAGTADTGATRAGSQPDTNFEAKARQIIDGWWNDDCGSTLNELTPIISTALAQAYETGAVEGQSPIIENLKAYISELEARLDMDRMFQLAEDGETLVPVEIAPEDRSFSADGIECRDATILLQEEHIKKLKSENAALRREVEPGRHEASKGCPVLPRASSPL